jgi:hypothetical protein
LTVAETVDACRNDEIGRRQTLLDADAPDDRLAQFNLPA